jgi:hypothetical protein
LTHPSEPVGRVGAVVDVRGVPAHLLEHLAGLEPVHAQRRVVRRRAELRRVAREAQARDALRVRLVEAPHALPAPHLPHLDLPGLVACRQQLRVPRPRAREHLARPRVTRPHTGMPSLSATAPARPAGCAPRRRPRGARAGPGSTASSCIMSSSFAWYLRSLRSFAVSWSHTSTKPSIVPAPPPRASAPSGLSAARGAGADPPLPGGRRAGEGRA